MEVFLRDFREIGARNESGRSISAVPFCFFSGGASVVSRTLFLSISIPRWCTRNPKKFPVNGFIFKPCYRIRSKVFLKSEKRLPAHPAKTSNGGKGGTEETKTGQA